MPTPADNALTRIAVALTAEEATAIEERFARFNPGWYGARAADILEHLYDHDGSLDVREPFAAANPDLAANPGTAYAVLAVVWLARRIVRDEVTGLLHRAGLLETVGAPDVTALAQEVRRMGIRTIGLVGIAADLGREDLGMALTGLAGDLAYTASNLEGLAKQQEGG